MTSTAKIVIVDQPNQPNVVEVITPGPMGPAGSVGPTGSQGIVGPTGVQGIQGPTGSVGPTGSTGATGATGAPSTVAGPTGPQGVVGPTGSQGVVGPTGAQGIQGIQGNVGPTGAQGNVGPTGAQGNVGPTGAQGLQGIQGEVGPTGAQGIQGIQGNQGIQGPTGSVGPTGSTGATGDTGPTGAASTVAGPTGPTGSQGAPGTSSTLFHYQADTNQQSGTPVAGHVYWNTVTQTSATSLVYSHLTSDGVDVDLFLTVLKLNDVVILQDESDSSNFQKWILTGNPTVVSNVSVTLPVALVSSGGTGTTGFVNNHQLISVLQSIGAQGPTGPTGVVGPTGAASTVAGPTGPQGVVGPTGSQGVQGEVGPTGAQGIQGIQGIQGTQGIQGVSGPTGSVGSTGAAGPTGPTGSGFTAQATGQSFATDGSLIGTNINWYVADTGAFAVGNFVKLTDTTVGSTYFYFARITLIQFAGGFGFAIHADVLSDGGTATVNPSSSWLMQLTGNTGPTGFVGPTGATGAASTVAGPTGPASTVAGPTGPQGTQGIAGPTGAVGPTGAAGTGSGTVTSVGILGGSTGLSFSNSPITSSGYMSLSGTLAVGYGGTGNNVYTFGAMLAFNGVTSYQIVPSASGYPLISNGPGALPGYGQISIGSATIGTLVATRGGTGMTSYVTGDLVYAGNTTTLYGLGIGTSGYVLTSNGSTPYWAPASGGSGGVTSFRTSLGGLTPQAITTGDIVLGGTLEVPNGGTGRASTSYGGILWATGGASLNELAIGGYGQVLTSNGSNPYWSNVSVNASDISGTLQPYQGGTGTTSSPSNGQILIGSYGNYSTANITAGANITITNGPGSITIAASGGGGGGPTIVNFNLNTTYGYIGNSTGGSRSKPLFAKEGTSPYYTAFAFRSYSGGLNITSTSIYSINGQDSTGAMFSYVSGSDFSSPMSFYAFDDVVSCYGMMVSNSAFQALITASAAAITSPSLAPKTAMSPYGSNPQITVYDNSLGMNWDNYGYNGLGIVVEKTGSNFDLYFATGDPSNTYGINVDQISVQADMSYNTYYSGMDFSAYGAYNNNGRFYVSLSVTNSTLTTLLNNTYLAS